MKLIDRFLNAITMYRLVLYYLIFLLVVACFYSYFHVLHYAIGSIVLSTAILLLVCLVTNKVFSFVFHAPTNQESAYITALILALILTPIKTLHDIPLFFWAGVLSMATKYILAINKKHLFNPVAIAVALTAFAFNGSASWWIGTAAMVPFTLLGILIVRKIRKSDLVIYFFLAAAVTMLIYSIILRSNYITVLKETISGSPIFFFAFIMLTEPLTTPPTIVLQIFYGILVGMLYVPQFHIGTLYTTPEIALILGNIYSYLVSPKGKIFTTLKEKVQTTASSIDFFFHLDKHLNFKPGQYMEWTLPHTHIDDRGNRRYFTIASSPTEQILQLGVKFYDNGSSYKKALKELDTKTQIIGAQIAGDFTLLNDTKKKLVFIAGGIGITPFRSMVKYLIDMNEKRDVVLFYVNKNSNEIAYADIFTQAERQLGIKTVYTLTDITNVPHDWTGKKGRINEHMIKENVPDYQSRIFYISGPNAMVTDCERMLLQMGIKKKNIKKDYFAGF